MQDMIEQRYLQQNHYAKGIALALKPWTLHRRSSNLLKEIYHLN